MSSRTRHSIPQVMCGHCDVELSASVKVVAGTKYLHRECPFCGVSSTAIWQAQPGSQTHLGGC